jgi:hypothetical protein
MRRGTGTRLSWTALAIGGAYIAVAGCSPSVGPQRAIASGQVVEQGTSAVLEGAFVVFAGFEAVTDAEGHWLIADVPVPESNEASVSVSLDKYRVYDDIVRFDAPGNLVVQLKPVDNPAIAGTLDGTVVDDATDAGIAGAEVTARMTITETVADEQHCHASDLGNWQISGIPIGDVVVEATAKGYLPARASVNVQPGRASNPLLRLPLVEGTRRVTVTGTCFDIETQEPVARVTISDDEDATPVTTDATGAFSMEGVLVGQRTFRANADGYDPGFVTILILAEPDPLAIGLSKASGKPPPPPGTISGRVETPGATSLASIGVFLRDATSGQTVAQTLTDDTGAFAFFVAPGSYRVTALLGGYTPAELSVTVEFGIPAPGLVLRLTPSAG